MTWRTYALSRSVSIALRHDAEGRVVESGEVTVAEGVAGTWGGEMARHAARAVGAMLDGERLTRGPNDTLALAVQSWGYAVLSFAGVVVRAERSAMDAAREAAAAAQDPPPDPGPSAGEGTRGD